MTKLNKAMLITAVVLFCVITIIASAHRNPDAAGVLASVIGLVFLCAIGVAVYFLPSIIGSKKKNATAIFLLNLFLGWTFIGWVVAVVWAASKD